MSEKPIRRRRRARTVEYNQEEPKPKPKKVPAKKPRPQKKHFLDGDSLLAELESFEMDSLLTGSPLKNVHVGDTVTGTVTRVDAELVFIDIGSKSEAMMNRDSSVTIEIGQEITATVLRTGGRGILIAQRLEQSTDIEAYQNAYEHRIPVKGTVIETNQGGFKVALGSIKGFCPHSQIDIHPREAEYYIQNQFEFEITELKTSEVILSRKRILQRQREEKKEALLQTLKVGEQYSGRIVRLTNFGAFVDLGGIDGLISQRTIKRFAVEVSEGADIIVSIDNINGDKISLSLPQHDPWLQVGTQFQSGKVYSGKITKRLDFGIFVQLAPGLEGLVHKSNLSDNPNEAPQQFANLHDTVQVRILSVDLEKRQLSLGIRQAQEADEMFTPQKPTVHKKSTIGDVFADVFSQLDED